MYLGILTSLLAAVCLKSPQSLTCVLWLHPRVLPSSAHSACCSVCPQCSLCCLPCCSCLWLNCSGLCCSCPWLSCSGPVLLVPWLSCSSLGDADLVRGLQAPAGLTTPFPLSLLKWCLVLNIFLFLTKTHLSQVSSFFLSHLNPSSSHPKLQVHSGTSEPFLDCLPPKCLTWIFYLLQTFPQMSPMTLANNVTVIAPYLTLFSPCSYLMHLIPLIKKRLKNVTCVHLSVCMVCTLCLVLWG